MSKESTKAAFARATGHLLLNLSPEEADSLTTYRKSEERIRMEQQLKQKLKQRQRPEQLQMLELQLQKQKQLQQKQKLKPNAKS